MLNATIHVRHGGTPPTALHVIDESGLCVDDRCNVEDRDWGIETNIAHNFDTFLGYGALVTVPSNLLVRTKISLNLRMTTRERLDSKFA